MTEVAWLCMVFAWFPLALCFTSHIRAIMLAPMLALLQAFILNTIELLFEIPLSELQIVAPVVIFIAGTLSFHSHKDLRSRLRQSSPYDVAFTAPLLSAVFVFHYMPVRVVTNDARFIWLNKARILSLHPSDTLYVLGGSIQQTHPHYPPAVPSVVSTLWNVTGTNDPNTLRLVVATLSVAMLGFVIDGLRNLLPDELRSHWNTRIVICACVALLISTGGALGPVGYLDLLLALTLCATAFELSRPDVSRICDFQIFVLASSAAIIKQEGFVYLVVLWATTSSTIWRTRQTALVSGASFYLLWAATKLRAQVKAPSSERSVLESLLSLLSGDFSQLKLALGQVEPHQIGQIIAYFSAAAFLYAATLRTRRSFPRLSYRPLHASTACFITLVLTYIFGPYHERLAWWVDSSLVRIATFPIALLICQMTLVACLQQPFTSLARGSQTAIEPPTRKSGSRTSDRESSRGKYAPN